MIDIMTILLTYIDNVENENVIDVVEDIIATLEFIYNIEDSDDEMSISDVWSDDSEEEEFLEDLNNFIDNN